MSIRVLALVSEAFGGHGGIALYNRDILTALCEDPDVREVVALPRLMPEDHGKLPQGLRYDIRGLGGKLAYIRAVKAIINEHSQFELVLCGHINLLPVSQYASYRLGAKQVLAIYGIDAWRPTSSRLTNYFARRQGHVYAISDITRSRFASWSGVDPNSIYLMPNAIHQEWYGPGKKNPELLRQYGLIDKKVIMTLGRYSSSERYKGVDEVLEVLPKLIAIQPDVHYLVVGDGDDRPRLEAKARRLDLSMHVTFTGRLKEEAKAEVFRLADAYVMPSYGEGFGFVFLEAMACGIPVVGSSTDGGREALRDGELGAIVDPKNNQQLQHAILEALNQEKRVPSGLAYFSFSAFSDRLKSMLSDVLVPKTQ